MRTTLLLLATLALASPARAVSVSCGGYYPEPDSPEHTIVFMSVTQNPDGSIASMTCDTKPGDPLIDCDVTDGACCACNVTRGFTPECTVLVNYTNSSTGGGCLSAFPACYYGNACDSTSGAFVVERTPAVTRHSKHRPHRKRNGN